MNQVEQWKQERNAALAKGRFDIGVTELRYKIEGYLAALSGDEVKALLEAAKAAELRILEVSVFNNVPGGQSQTVLGQLRAAIAAFEERTP